MRPVRCCCPATSIRISWGARPSLKAAGTCCQLAYSLAPLPLLQFCASAGEVLKLSMSSSFATGDRALCFGFPSKRCSGEAYTS
jgi:hypothetical protein